MYEFGNGVPKCYAEAVWWYRLAAAQGDKDALQHLHPLDKAGPRSDSPISAPVLAQDLTRRDRLLIRKARDTLGIGKRTGAEPHTNVPV
jgi:TPR repeat protein